MLEEKKEEEEKGGGEKSKLEEEKERKNRRCEYIRRKIFQRQKLIDITNSANSQHQTDRRRFQVLKRRKNRE
jgi:hypothetical protein